MSHNLLDSEYLNTILYVGYCHLVGIKHVLMYSLDACILSVIFMYYISIPDRISIALLDVPLTIKHYILYGQARFDSAHGFSGNTMRLCW